MNEFSFDLIGIFREIFKKKLFLLLLSVAALIISIIFCLQQQKRYTSETVFIVKNPLLIDRNYVFRTTSYEHKDYFALPDDVDHIKTIAKSDGMVWHVIEKFDLAKAYHMEGDPRLVEKVKDNFKTIMEDTKNIELFYTDPDPKRAMEITKAAREYLETTFLNYFRTTNKDVTESLKEKVAAMSDSITHLDDSISTLRAASGNYSQMLPARGTTIASSGQTVSAASAASLEHLQEIIVQKDKLAADIAGYRSLINEFEVMASGKLRLFYVVQEAYVPGLPSHPKTLIVVAASTLGALFFGCILILLSALYKKVMKTPSH